VIRSEAEMGIVRMLVGCLLVVAVSSTQAAQPTSPTTQGAVLFEGAQLIAGDGRAPTDNSAFVVENGRFVQVGRKGTVPLPQGARRIDLTGKTVMPALIDLHSHLGYYDVKTMINSAQNYTRANLIDHLNRYAYHGIAATLSLGLDRGELPFQLRAATGSDTALFHTAGRGIAWPNAGPRADYWRDAPYGVRTEAEARTAVQELAARKVDFVKIWVDDREGTVPKLPPALYRAVIDEAHAHKLRVVAHVYYLADGKDLLRAGIDGFAHGIRDLEVDEEFIGLFKARPEVFLIPNLPDRAPAASDLSFLSETLPSEQIAPMRETSAKGSPARPRLFDVQARSLARLNAAGVRIGFGTDAGVGSPLGWSAHAELADMVEAGLTPAQALVAATRMSAAILRLDQHGMVANGKSADFIVLDASPLENITNTRRIAAVYLAGREVDRAKLRAGWSGRSSD
jgi:imidazolonepropionase-like amidohydrolase